HKLFKPAGDDGADTGGTDTGNVVLDEGNPVSNEDEEVDLGEVAGTEEGEGDGESDGVVITIGNEQPAEEEEEQARAPEWVRELRKSNREKVRVIRELLAKVSQAAPSPAAIVLGAKPTLATCDYDETKFEADLEAWHARKQEVEAQQRERATAEQKSKDAWQAKLADYGKRKTELKVKDFEDAEDVAKEVFSVTQQGVILNGAENSAVLIYALGKNPKKAKELATITDPVKFAFAVAKLETQLKVTPRKVAPTPERTIRGGATGAAIDSALDKLMAEADKTGDRTKVAQYHRNKKQAQR
ncbi:MAG: hypothetical protein HXX19_13065, partial [Rhodoferax sp.]|nr:hypothetical protein [Rhodoferax sp.]